MILLSADGLPLLTAGGLPAIASAIPAVPTYYVATTGSDSTGTGTIGAPYRTIGGALSARGGGCEYIVRDGVYTDTNQINPSSGTAEAWTIIRSENPHGAVLRHGNYATFRPRDKSYIRVQGFHFDLLTDGGGVAATWCHHIEMLDCLVTGGTHHAFSGQWSDFLRAEGNIIRGGRYSSWWSAISTYQAYNRSQDPTPGTRFWYSRNDISDCYQAGGPYTDGNGIIFDDSWCWQTGTEITNKVVLAFDAGSVEFWRGQTVTGQTSGATATIAWTAVDIGSYGAGTAAGRLGMESVSGTFEDNEPLLVGGVQHALRDGSGELEVGQPGKYAFDARAEGNLVVNCGGKGIQAFMSDNVSIIGNTCAYNGHPSQTNDGTWWAEISVSYSDGCIVANNIALSDRTRHDGNQRPYADTGIDGSNAGTVWENNLARYTSGTQSGFATVDGGATGPQIGDNPLLGADPLLLSPDADRSAADFRLGENSPAIDAGTAAYGLPDFDLEGNPRVNGAAVDLGAYEYTPAIPASALTDLDGETITEDGTGDFITEDAA